ncbi:MAG: flagellar basal body-associated FliL family protein [Methylococcales bacterium]|jgi:flagellar FliL protein|nr:flagellar basal body-associated FliL family protein [Methylococcales bacterium]MBT6794557.1 flagellar basal body-associated FliL family protein [Methylococcales bacterium]
MAEDELEDEDELEGKEPKNILKILVFVLAALLLIGVSVAATLYLTGFFDVKDEQSVAVLNELEDSTKDADGNLKEKELPEKQKKETPETQQFEQSYQEMKSKFTVNIPNSKKYLQFSISVMTHYDEKVLGNVDKHQTALRSAILQVVRQKPVETYNSEDGMASVLIEIKEAMNSVLMGYEDFGGIEEVFFTEFVVQ